MVCPKCGATVLKGDVTCPKCGEVIKTVAQDEYDVSNQTRSRFMLLFLTWIGCWNGTHLKWLGYEDKAIQTKERFGFRVSYIVNPVKLIFWVCITMPYILIEIISVTFGKYSKDADGRRVVYFK